MVKIFILDHLKYTPFDKDFVRKDYDYLIENRLLFTDNPEEADIFVSSNEKNIMRKFSTHKFSKPILVWTNEPRLSKRTKSPYRLFGISPKIHVMNVYTGEVLTDPLQYQGKRFTSKNKLNNLKFSDFTFNHRKLVALMSYYRGGKNSALKIHGKNIDLVKLRSDIALDGKASGAIDIIGRGWPAGISQEDSRGENWVYRKKEILNSYHFNLCFENTVYPNYISEKIWDSIENYCLPIYYGGKTSSIYEFFPKKSFIDYKDFSHPLELYDFISTISRQEYIRRMNTCLNVYNDLCDQPESFWQKKKKPMLDNIVLKARHLKK